VSGLRDKGSFGSDTPDHGRRSGGGHFRVTLVSDAFRGRTQLERHRLVYAAVAPLMSGAVHALNIVARTPEEGI